MRQHESVLLSFRDVKGYLLQEEWCSLCRPTPQRVQHEPIGSIFQWIHAASPKQKQTKINGSAI